MQKGCAAFFQVQFWKYKNKSTKNILFKTEKIRKIFANTNICAIIKNKNSIKNLVVKTKI